MKIFRGSSISTVENVIILEKGDCYHRKKTIASTPQPAFHQPPSFHWVPPAAPSSRHCSTFSGLEPEHRSSQDGPALNWQSFFVLPWEKWKYMIMIYILDSWGALQFLSVFLFSKASLLNLERIARQIQSAREKPRFWLKPSSLVPLKNSRSKSQVWGTSLWHLHLPQ